MQKKCFFGDLCSSSTLRVHYKSGGTGVSGLTRGLATLPKVDAGAFSGQR